MYNPMESALTMQKMFRVFVAVNKSRDEEIKKLKYALEDIQEQAKLDFKRRIYEWAKEALKDGE